MTTIQQPARRFSEIIGLGVHRPSVVVSNEDICKNIDSSDEWIRERSGIIERRFADSSTSIIDMAVDASRKAIDDAGISPSQINTVLLATISHPYQTPSAAVLVANRLGLDDVGATDLSAACAGFTYAIGIADGLISTCQSDYVLVIGVEKLSDWTDKHDRSSAFIFADGAGAIVLGPSDSPGVGPTVWGSDGSEFDAIVCLPDWLSLRNNNETEGAWPVLHMQGQKVFRWAVGEMPDVAARAIAKAGLEPSDIDLFIPHQANMRITDAMVKSLGLRADVKIARDIQTAGNTSAASIPLAMEKMRSEGVAQKGELALLIGFGAGLAYAAQVVRFP
jgi:3-oxoacyl-[acyl-carrier-protein] synthase-3